MAMGKWVGLLVLSAGFAGFSGGVIASEAVPSPTREDSIWVLPKPVSPKSNITTPYRVSLGQQLFFDPRLSRNGNMSCATCHNPSMGWSDGLKTARGHDGKLLPRATPSITNVAYSKILMWDGRKPDLEAQALGPMESSDEMNTDFDQMLGFLKTNEKYVQLFSRAYPGEGVVKETVAKAIASFQRTVIVNDSPFDRWLAGNKSAISMSQWRGFQLFKGKANCVACHSAPNFTDNGFHNIGLSQWGDADADLGRYMIKKIKVNRGAFKTTPLRDIASTAPYFHDGSASTLWQVVDHYAKGGEVKTNLSPNLLELQLTALEKQDLVDFLHSLSAPVKPMMVPVLP